MGTKNYDELSKEIITLVGGVKNISDLTHCVTRLRFKLINTEKASKDELKKLKGVLTVVEGNGQFQVVVGNAVEEIYDSIIKLYPIKSDGSVSPDEKKSGNVLTRALNTMSAIVNPIVIALAGAGMIKALLVVLTTTLGILDNTGSTYKILAAASNSVFYFLPLFLAVSSAKTFKCNLFISLAIVAALLEPNFTGLMESAGDVSSFMGIPVVLMGYSGTLVPAIISVFVYSKLEKLLKKFIPKSIELFALAFAALLVMVPLTVMVIGPIGVTLANGVGDFVNLMSERNGLITGGIIGAGWTFLVMLGIHWGVVPIMIYNISEYGFDVVRPMVAAATFASAGAAFGVFLKSKKRENKTFALTAMVPALLGGITEPIVYGISLKYRRPFIAQVIGGGIAGAFMGMMKTKAIVYVFPALTTLPAFLGNTFVYFLIGIALAYGITATLTWFLGFEEEGLTSAPSAKEGEILSSCIVGEAIPLSSVNDEVFASGALGKGIAVIPEKGVLYAPANGKIETIFSTGHAVGMTTDQGAEILMHIGINTVEMNGEGFKNHVSDGQKVKKGDILVEFDLDKIVAAGYDPTTMMIITNSDTFSDVTELTADHAVMGTNILKVMG